MRLPRCTVTPVLCLLLVSGGASACAGGPRMSYVTEGQTRTAREAEEFARDLDVEAWSRLGPDETAEARRSALASLRRRGDQASALADLLTDEVSAGDSSVPAYAEECTVDGVDAWMVVEVWGSDAAEPLEHKRLWLLSRPEGRVLSASSYR